MAESKGKIGSLFFSMTLVTSDFKKKIGEARKVLAKQGKAMRGAFKAIAKGGAIIGAAFTGAVVGMLAFAKSTAAAINEQLLLADSIGSTQAAIAGLEIASQRFGVSQDTLIDKMREAGGLDAFKDIATQVKNAGSEMDQLRMAQELLGAEGLKLLPILQQGAEGLNAMEKEAKQLGLALSPKQIAETEAAWKEWEDTLLNIKGLARQIGTSFMEFFGTVSSGVKAFIVTFGDDIKSAFQSIADFMVKTVRIGFDAFIKFGIPIINNLLGFVDQLGFAFGNLFSFMSGGAKTAFNGVGNLILGLTEFLATFRQSLIAGVAGAIKSVITFAFNVLAGFNTFIGDQISTLVFLLNSVGAVSDEFAFETASAFDKQSQSIKKFGEELAKPFAETEDFYTNEAAKILEKIAKKNEEDQLSFKSVLGSFLTSFDGLAKNAGKITSKATSKAIENATPKFAGIALSGSVEAFQAENEQIRIDQLNESRKQTVEMKKQTHFLKELAII